MFSNYDYPTTILKYEMENDNWPPIIRIRHDSPNVGLTSSIEAAASEAQPKMPRVNTGWSFHVSSSHLTIFMRVLAPMPDLPVL
jgi:hypothetical protein